MAAVEFGRAVVVRGSGPVGAAVHSYILFVRESAAEAS